MKININTKFVIKNFYLKIMLYLLNKFSITLDDKAKYISNLNINTSGCTTLTFDNFINIIEKIKNDENTNNQYYYNEFTYNLQPYNHVKLFLDIDCKIENNMTIDVIIKELKNLIALLLKYISDTLVNYVCNGSTQNIHNNIFVTKSNDPNKHSFHIIFNNIFFNLEHYKVIKSFIYYFINSNEYINIFKKHIDLCVYKREIIFRYIYCLKSKDVLYFHEPFLEFSDNIFEPYVHNNFVLNENNINNEYQMTNEEFNMEDYIIDIDKYTNDIDKYHELLMNFSIFIKNEKLGEYILVDNIINRPVINPHVDINSETPYYIKYLNGNSLFQKLISIMCNVKIKNFFNKIHVDNSFYTIKEKMTFELDEIIEININECPKCERKHKNKFYIKFDISGITLSKFGRPTSCKLLPLKYDYEPLTIQNICRYIIDNDLIKRLDQNTYVVWENNVWKSITDDSDLINFIYQNNRFNFQDKTNIVNTKVLLLKKFIPSILGNNYIEITQDPYLLKFNNGFLDLKTKNFIPNSENTKNYYKVYGIQEDYYSFEELSKSPDFMTQYNMVKELFDQIIFNNNDELSSVAFKKNLSSILYSGHKECITFFVGKTSGGKSTVKLLLEILFQDSFLELPIQCYTKKLDPNTPNPWLGNVNYKLVSFASEKSECEHFKTISFKQMTEQQIKARILNSNSCKQINNLTQFIDINFDPTFDFQDPALLKRYCVIFFKSYFSPKDEIDKEIKCENRTLYDKNEKLEEIIKREDVNLKRSLYTILINWFFENNSKNLNMANCLTTGTRINSNDTKFKDFVYFHTISKLAHRREHIIIPKSLNYYSSKKVGNLIDGAYILIIKTYLVKRLCELYSEYLNNEIMSNSVINVQFNNPTSSLDEDLNVIIEPELQEFKKYILNLFPGYYSTRCLKEDLIED